MNRVGIARVWATSSVASSDLPSRTNSYRYRYRDPRRYGVEGPLLCRDYLETLVAWHRALAALGYGSRTSSLEPGTATDSSPGPSSLELEHTTASLDVETRQDPARQAGAGSRHPQTPTGRLCGCRVWYGLCCWFHGERVELSWGFTLVV